MNPIIMTIVCVFVGGGLAGATVVGLVNSQTAPPDQSPANVSNPVLDYGSTE